MNHSQTSMFIVYILYSEKLNRFYTGFTSNFDVRYQFHQTAADPKKFTAKANDWEIFIKIQCATKSQGYAIEKHIKKMKSQTYIKNLIIYPEIIEKLKLKYL